MDAESPDGSAWSYQYWERPEFHMDYYAPYGWRSIAHTDPFYKWFKWPTEHPPHRATQEWAESFPVGSRVQHVCTGRPGTVAYMSIFIYDIVVEALLTYLHRW